MGVYLTFKIGLGFGVVFLVCLFVLFLMGKPLNNVLDLLYLLFDFCVTVKPGRNSQVCCCFYFTFLLVPDTGGR